MPGRGCEGLMLSCAEGSKSSQRKGLMNMSTCRHKFQVVEVLGCETATHPAKGMCSLAGSEYLRYLFTAYGQAEPQFDQLERH